MSRRIRWESNRSTSEERNWDIRKKNFLTEKMRHPISCQVNMQWYSKIGQSSYFFWLVWGRTGEVILIQGPTPCHYLSLPRTLMGEAWCPGHTRAQSWELSSTRSCAIPDVGEHHWDRPEVEEWNHTIFSHAFCFKYSLGINSKEYIHQRNRK